MNSFIVLTKEETKDEMKKKDFAFDEVSRVADSYWIFNPDYNHLYYETDSLKDAKEMVQTLINAKKYNL